jgi:hypothetical protein
MLENLRVMDRTVAEGFVLATRLYHAAIQMMYSEPEFAYLFLVTCLETISSVVLKKYRPRNTSDFLDTRMKGWAEFSDLLPVSRRVMFKKLLLQNEHYTIRKIIKFVTENLPSGFWSATDDSAKPDYMISYVGPGPDGRGQETLRRSSKALNDYELIDKNDLEKTLKNIYAARSSFVHRGIRFPPTIVLGYFRRVPGAAFDELMRNANKKSRKRRPAIPPLLTLERLVSESMVNYLIKANGKIRRVNRVKSNRSNK